MVYAIKITDVAQLKQCIIDCWQEIPQEEINKATNAFQNTKNTAKSYKSKWWKYWKNKVFMLFWSAKNVAIFNVFPIFFILTPVHLSKWSFSKKAQKIARKQFKLYIFIFSMWFSPMKILWNFIHPAFVRRISLHFV